MLPIYLYFIVMMIEHLLTCLPPIKQTDVVNVIYMSGQCFIFRTAGMMSWVRYDVIGRVGFHRSYVMS